MEGRGFRDLKADFAAKNAVIYGVSFDSVQENKAFAEKFDFNYPLLCDTTRAMGVAYGAADSPSDGYAKRIGVVIGADGKIVEYSPKVSAQSYPAEVLSRL
ncbi:MAG: redoxin domain-containing protein [Polyangiaceae bacterium]|nr:redoxin domain-containing protein [Polyangiaceae bacterium]